MSVVSSVFKMDFKRIPLFLVIGLFLTFAITNVVWAGFGISPPYVTNENLTQGSHYEKKIELGRGQAEEELRIEVTIGVPGANDWISIDKGDSFILAKGERRTAMTVLVDVPRDAEFGTYTGYIRIKTIPIGPSPAGGGVSIILGAQIDVDLEVKDIQTFDFKVRSVEVYNLEEGHKLWWLYFPGRIKFVMEIENLGNTKAAPTKVIFDIYDSKREELLESTETTKMEKVEPFEIQKIVAELPTKLPPGSYWAKFKIFKEDEIVREEELHLGIFPKGTITGYKGYGFDGLSPKDKASVIGIILGILAIVGFGGWQGYRFWGKRTKKKPRKRKKKKLAKISNNL